MRYASVLQQFTLRSGLLTAQYTMRRVRFGAIFGEFLTEIFENFPRPQHFGFEIAPKSALLRVLQPAHEPQRSPVTVPSVRMLRHVRFRAILGEILTEIFETFSRPRNFAIEIARDRAEIRYPPCAAAWPRASEVPRHCAERRHAAARASDSVRFSANFGPKFSKNFRGHKFLGSKSRRKPLCPTC